MGPGSLSRASLEVSLDLQNLESAAFETWVDELRARGVGFYGR